MIKEIQSEAEYPDLVSVLRVSFGTVAEQYNLTEANAPTNPAFTTIEKLKAYLTKSVRLFGLFQEERIVGCVAIEPARNKGDLYYIARLAVVPQERHRGYGSMLLAYAMEEIERKGGTTASIGIINENTILKEWYRSKGFIEVERKSFSHLPFEVCFMSKAIFAEG